MSLCLVVKTCQLLKYHSYTSLDISLKGIMELFRLTVWCSFESYDWNTHYQEKKKRTYRLTHLSCGPKNPLRVDAAQWLFSKHSQVIDSVELCLRAAEHSINSGSGILLHKESPFSKEFLMHLNT